MIHAILLLCVAVFTVLSTVAGCYGVVMLYRRNRAAGGSVAMSLVFVAYALCIAHAGNDSHKHPAAPSARLLFDVSLYDNGSVATNDYPAIRWRYDPWIANDTLHIDARPKASTNDADWVQYHVGKVTEASWTGYMPACTGMTVYVWSEYVPPSPVSTNGVYYLDYLARPLDDEPDDGVDARWVLLRTPIYDEFKRLMSPPDLPRPLAVNDIETTEENDNQEEK